jgi:predicted MFS family arabinose efflux permease
MISLGGMAVGMALLTVGVQTLPGTIVLAATVGGFGGMLMVPQQHRLFATAPDAPTVALSLNGSAIYLGGGIGSAFGGVVLAGAGVDWLPLAGALVALIGLGFALAYRRAPVMAMR